MIKAILFDLDGTLLDTLEDLSEAVNFALRKRGFPLHSVSEYRMMVGHGVRNLVSVALPEDQQQDDSLTDACLRDFKQYYTSHIDVYTRPYPGIPGLLARLHREGISLAVASNKFQEGAEYLVRSFFPEIPFAAILGNRDGYPLKPDPEIVREVLRRAGADAAGAVMVGDSMTDMRTAFNGGIRAVAVSWGYRSLAPSDQYSLVHSAEELEQLLLSV